MSKRGYIIFYQLNLEKLKRGEKIKSYGKSCDSKSYVKYQSRFVVLGKYCHSYIS